MSIYHRHHIIPRHMGGSDDPSNIIEITIEEHAQAHRKLWEEHGNEYDHIAWRCLAGLITGEEARIEAVKVAVTGVAKSDEHRKKISEARKKNWANNDDLRRKISERGKGNKNGRFHAGWIPTEETKQRMSAAKKDRPQRRCSCILCHKEISVSNIVSHYRWRHKKGGE